MENKLNTKDVPEAPPRNFHSHLRASPGSRAHPNCESAWVWIFYLGVTLPPCQIRALTVVQREGNIGGATRLFQLCAEWWEG